MNGEILIPIIVGLLYLLAHLVWWVLIISGLVWFVMRVFR